MNDFQFWDELGKIFNAVMAYQEKAVEFNKRFINPWIPLGNVFDNRDRNNDAVRAYHKAIELDPNNAQNWYELGNVHFRMKSYDEAAEAYRQAIEIEPGHGSACSNLALTLANQGRLAEAIPLYQKSIQLLRDDKEKAVAWNRLGNVHRKLNEYALAVEAFQRADELDAENAGFKDDLEEAPSPHAPGDEGAMAGLPDVTALQSLDPLQFMAASGRLEDRRSAPADEAEPSLAPAPTESEQPTEVNILASQPEFTAAGLSESSDADTTEALADSAPRSDAGDSSKERAAASVRETETDEHVPMSVYAAYEEYLRDSDQAIGFAAQERAEQDHVEEKAPDPAPETIPPAPAAKVDSSGELQIEMDTRNAHVWNELGNIYFNNGQFDDAVIAYSKAIELDRWFAWPYSNLALTYVQRDRLSEAILLYQRSIELFRDPKDQAISWNRLGNVYRRLNDYEHAIAAYQHADDLDPENATLSLQSRFSLLGNFAAEPKPSLVS